MLYKRINKKKSKEEIINTIIIIEIIKEVNHMAITAEIIMKTTIKSLKGD